LRPLSDKTAWTLIALLAVAGLGTTGYLTYSHYADQVTVCAGIGSCEYVQNSSYSRMAGVPVALMGLGFFVALEGLALLRLARLPLAMEFGQQAAFSMTLGGLAFVAYLTYVELFVIDAVCPWCVATACITLACFSVVALTTVFSLPESAAEPG